MKFIKTNNMEEKKSHVSITKIGMYGMKGNCVIKKPGGVVEMKVDNKFFFSFADVNSINLSTMTHFFFPANNNHFV